MPVVRWSLKRSQPWDLLIAHFVFCAGQFLSQEHAIELFLLLVVCPNFYVARRFFMLWYVSICTYRGSGEDMSVHAFCTCVAQFRFIIVNVEEVVLLLSTDNAKAAEE